MISRYNTQYTKGIVSPEWSPGAGFGTGVLFLGFSGNGCPVPRAMVELCRVADMSSRTLMCISQPLQRYYNQYMAQVENCSDSE